MVDTLKLAKRLEDAGLDRPVAEAMAEAFADSTVETVATKHDMREQVGVLRAEIQASADTLRAEMDGLGKALRTEMHATAETLRAEMESLRAETHGVAQTLRAEMQALRWQVIGAVALMLLVHLGAVWVLVAAHAP